MKNILVTGGAGYIGSHACKALKKAGYNPVAFDNLSRGFEESVKYGPLVKGDITSASDLKKMFEKYDFYAVMHFAGLAYVGESVQEPEKYWTNNVVGSVCLLNQCVESKVSKFIFSSTCSMYGDSAGELINEDTPVNPLNPYAQTKYVIEQVIANYSKAYGIKACSLRYFNVAGSDPEVEIGESHDPETHLIPNVIKAALTDSEVFVYGNDFSTPDGTCVRDYIHVTDLVEAHLKALILLEKNSSENVNVLNLGTGKGYSVMEIVKQVEKITSKKIKYKIVDRRDGDGAYLVSDNAKAKKVLDWEPLFSDLSSQIETAFIWHEKLSRTS